MKIGAKLRGIHCVRGKIEIYQSALVCAKKTSGGTFSSSSPPGRLFPFFGRDRHRNSHGRGTTARTWFSRKIQSCAYQLPRETIQKYKGLFHPVWMFFFLALHTTISYKLHHIMPMMFRSVKLVQIRSPYKRDILTMNYIQQYRQRVHRGHVIHICLIPVIL